MYQGRGPNTTESTQESKVDRYESKGIDLDYSKQPKVFSNTASHGFKILKDYAQGGDLNMTNNANASHAADEHTPLRPTENDYFE